MIDEVLESIKRHLDYVNATNQKSIRDIEIEVMYKEIERLNAELGLYKDNHKHLNNLLEQKDNIINKAIEEIDLNICGGSISNARKVIEILKGK